MKRVFAGISALRFLFVVTTCSNKTASNYFFNDPEKTIDERVENLLQQLTL